MGKKLKVLSSIIIFSLIFNISFNVFATEETQEEATNELSIVNGQERQNEETNNNIEEKKIQNTNAEQENLDSNDLDIGKLSEENLEIQNTNLKSRAAISTYSLDSYEGTLIDGKDVTTKVYVNRDGKNYTYSRENGLNFVRIKRYCFETGEYTDIFSNWNNFDVESVRGYYVQDKVIYHALYSTREYDELRIVGYDTETETICYDQTFPITYDQFEGEFCIDSNHNIYLLTAGSTEEELTILSYTKDGNPIDSYTKSGIYVNGCNAIDLIGTNKQNTVIFCALGINQGGIPSWWNDCIIKIDNGKFVNNEIYTMREYGGMLWTFLDDSQTHAYDQYGEFYEINYNANTESGVSYTIKGSIDIDGSYSNIASITSHDDTYAYVGGVQGILHIYNWHTNEIEKYLSIGEDKRITGVYKNGNDILIEYLKNGEFYALTVNLSDYDNVTQNIEITDHVALTHTKLQIKNKYDKLSIVNTTSNLYDQTPSISAPYTAGSLLPQVKTDTLNQINYFRWIAGLDNITQNDQYMDYSQKGAVLLAARNILTHYPSRPSDMDEEFYKQGYSATSAGIGYSANISQGTLMAYSIKGYIDDTSNMYKDVGHRLSLLDPKATSASYGFASRYGVVNVFRDGERNNNEGYYAWPSPGNFPVESINYNAMWSVTLTNKGYFVETPKYIVLKANGKEYSSANEDFSLYYDNIYRTYFFDIPDELKNYLTDGNYSIQNGKSVEVEVHGLADNYGNTYVIKYPINFFSLDKVLTGISLDTASIRIGDTKKLELKMTPEGAQPDGEIKWSSSNTNVATISNDGTITAKTKGLTTITAEVDGLKTTATINVVDYILGDVNGDGEITLVDYGNILAHVKGTKLLTGQNLKAADVNLDGEVTLVDYGKVLAYVKRNIQF